MRPAFCRIPTFGTLLMLADIAHAANDANARVTAAFIHGYARIQSGGGGQP